MADGLRMAVEPRRLAATPGEPFTLTLEVFNSSTIIDGYRVTILGLDQQWYLAAPEVLSLFPETDGTMVLTITLPVGFPAGEHTLGVLMTSASREETTALEEIVLSVAPVEDAELNLEPQAITAGGTARFGVGIFNRGNQPVRFTLSGEDPESRLSFKFRPEVVEVPPGEQVWSQAVASGRRPFLGSPEARVMTIQAIGEGEPIEAVGTFLQKPLIPRWVLTLLSILLALAVWAFILLWGIDRVVGDDTAEGDGTEQDGTAGGAGGAGGGDGGDGLVGTITGKATALGLDPPFVAGVTVDAFSIGAPGEIAASAETGDDGTYVLEGLPTDSYKVRFASPGYRTVWYPAADSFGSSASVAVEGAEVAGISVVMEGEPGTIAGVFVADPDDPTATVSLLGLQDLVDGQEPHRDSGTFTAGYEFTGVPTPGSYQVSISKPGFAVFVLEVVLGPGEVKRGLEAMLLGLDGTVTGLVSDADGPLGGVTVVASGPIEATTTSLTDGAVGAYELSDLATPGRYTLSFSKEGYQTATLAVELEPGGSSIQDVTLQTADAAISGTVRDAATGGALGGVTVTATSGDIVVASTSVTTGTGRGTYSVTGLGAGTYSVVFSRSGYLSETLSVTLRESERLEGIDVDLAVDPGPASISGTTRDADGNSLLGGVLVTVTDGTNTVTATTATTGAVGAYTVANLAAGSYTVSFAREGFRTETTSVTLTAGQKRTGVDAALRSVGSRPIFGTVSDRTGPLGSVVVTVSGDAIGSNGNLTAITPRTATTVASGPEKGTYEFALLATPGSYTVSVNESQRGYLPVSEIINLATDASREVNFVLVGADGSVTGSVSGPDPFFGEGTVALDGVTVTLTGPSVNGAPVTRTTTTNDDGGYSFGGLPTPGAYTLAFTATYHQPKSATFTLAPSEGSSTPKVLPPTSLVLYAKGSIGGSLVGDDPFDGVAGPVPVAGVTVTATLDANPSVTGSAVTNAQGLYAINNLTTPGTYTVSFSSPRWAATGYSQALTPGQDYVRATPTTMTIQVGKIQGTVTCSNGGGPFANVLATAKRDGAITEGSPVLTNGSGFYEIFDVPGGAAYRVEFRAPGGSPTGLSDPLRSLAKGATLVIDFSLTCPG